VGRLRAGLGQFHAAERSRHLPDGMRWCNVIEAVELFFSEPAAKGDYQDIEDAHSEQLTLKKSA
jgi:hypothetical protein